MYREMKQYYLLEERKDRLYRQLFERPLKQSETLRRIRLELDEIYKRQGKYQTEYRALIKLAIAAARRRKHG